MSQRCILDVLDGPWHPITSAAVIVVTVLAVWAVVWIHGAIHRSPVHR